MPGRRSTRAQTPSVAAGGTQAIAKKNRRGTTRATGSGPGKASTSPATPAVAQRRWDRRRPCGCGTVAAMADVTEYWGRFQASDEQVMAGLRRVVASAEGESEHQRCQGLRDFIRAYGVPRTFRGMSADNVQCLAPVVRHLRAVWGKGIATSAADLAHEVDVLAAVCKAAGFGRNVSFASKALNMLGWEAPLYSSECLAYLHLPRNAPYAQFLSAWTAAFLPKRHAYKGAARHQLRAQEGSSLPPETWFAMRGFDILLLREGGPMRK
jgi:hypothetical protein